MNRKANTILWALIACLLWSTAYAGIKLGLQCDKPFHFAGVRFIISGIIILPFTVSPRLYIKSVKENWRVIAMVTFFQIIVNYALFYLGLQLVPNEKPEWITITGMLIITGSLVMFFRNNKESQS